MIMLRLKLNRKHPGTDEEMEERQDYVKEDEDE